MSKPTRLNEKSREQQSSGGGGGQRRRHPHRKSCRFCADKIVTIDFKKVDQIRIFLSERGKIVPRRITGNCAKHQRALTTAIKRARAVALLPYIAE